MTRVLVTGANGFVGRALCHTMMEYGYLVRGAVRSPAKRTQLPSGVEPTLVGDIGPDTDWKNSLTDVEIIIHLAARVHVMKEKAIDPQGEFLRINTVVTKRLARLAAFSGIRRFVFVSTIKVNGEQTKETPFTEADLPRPQDHYAVSKWQAELGLQKIAKETGLEVVIMRLPLVYGPGVKGNFLRLMQWVDRGMPLPLAKINNRRSLIGVENLTDLLLRCAQHPKAAGETFLAADGAALSTSDIIRCLASAFGRPAHLFPLPKAPLRLAAHALKREDIMNRLFGSLMVDSQKARRLLDWAPPLSVEEGFAQTAQWYLSQQGIN